MCVADRPPPEKELQTPLHFELVPQTPERQSEAPVVQAFPSSHLEHTGPPQSTSVSFTFWTLSSHVGAVARVQARACACVCKWM